MRLKRERWCVVSGQVEEELGPYNIACFTKELHTED